MPPLIAVRELGPSGLVPLVAVSDGVQRGGGGDCEGGMHLGFGQDHGGLGFVLAVQAAARAALSAG